MVNVAVFLIKIVPEGIRTPDPRLRRPLLYPAELQVQAFGGTSKLNIASKLNQKHYSVKSG